MNYHISASILSADFSRLGEEVNAVMQAGADSIHVDVMDNHYVPNLTFGPMVCQSLRDAGIKAPLNVHLMTKPVDRLIVRFAEAGATSIQFHPEASDHIDRSLQLIRDNGCKAGLVLNPATPLNILDYVLDKLDSILIMSVNPGFGGQKFIPEVLQKIRDIKKMTDERKKSLVLAVDGGIKLENVRSVAEAGADHFIMGSAIFSQPDYSIILAELREELSHVKTKKRGIF